MQSEISLDVEAYVADEVNKRRFRWRLRAPGEMDYASPESFATKREAIRNGEIARERARLRGRLSR